MNIADFVALYPQYAFNWHANISRQRRVFDGDTLFNLPSELFTDAPYTHSRRGHPNRNQTKTHKQCCKCFRVMRNDFFYRRHDYMHSMCLECQSESANTRYMAGRDKKKQMRLAVGRYITPRCISCGFDLSVYALDMHHLGGKEETVSERITAFVQAPSPDNADALIAEAERCLCLCANCHRMIHGGEISIVGAEPLRYSRDELLAIAHGDSLIQFRLYASLAVSD